MIASTATAPIPSSIPAEARPSRANRDRGAGSVSGGGWVVAVRIGPLLQVKRRARVGRDIAFRDREFRSLVIVTRLPSTLGARIRGMVRGMPIVHLSRRERLLVRSVAPLWIPRHPIPRLSRPRHPVPRLPLAQEPGLPVRDGRDPWLSPHRSPPVAPRRAPTAPGSTPVRPEPCRRFRHLH